VLVCIPTTGDAGREDTVCDHFGSAPYFTLYDTDADRFTVLENQNAHHGHGACHPMHQLSSYTLTAVICGGIGRRAVATFNASGIKVYAPGTKAVAEVVEGLRAGTLTEIDPARSCGGRGAGPRGR